MVLLHLLHALDCPKRRLGDQDMNISTNEGIGAVWETFLSATVPYDKDHS